MNLISGFGRTAFAAAGFAVALWPMHPAHAQDPDAPTHSGQVIEPQLERRTIQVPRIDTEDFEVGAYAGILSVEDFGSKSVVGARLAYHVTETFFIEGVYGKSSVSDENYAQKALPVFSQREVDLTYYNISLGINLLPGEIFITDNWTLASAFYVIGGIGNTNFDREDRTTINLGVGLRILLTDWFAVHFDMRDHVWESDLLGTNKFTHNFEMHGGLTVFF